MIAESRLWQELLAAGVSGSACLSVSPDPRRVPVGPSDTITRTSDGIRIAIDWPDAATQQTQLATATAVIQAHDGTATEGERLDTVTHRQRATAALLIRASSQWSGLSAARRNRIQAIIDEAAAAAVAKLT